MSLVRHPRVQPPSSKAPWITPNLDALLMRALAPVARAALPVGRGDAQGALRRSSRRSRRAPTPSATADFLRGLYDTVAKEERAERDRLLAESARAARAASPRRVVDAGMPVPLALLESGQHQAAVPQGRGLERGRRLHGARHRQPLPGDPQDRRGRHGHRLRRRARRDRQGRGDQDSAPRLLDAAGSGGDGSGARRGRRRASATRTSSTSPTSARPRTAAPTS